MSISDTTRHSSKQVLTERYVCVGYNQRMTDIQASIGREQLKRLDWIVRRRIELAERYTRRRWPNIRHSRRRTFPSSPAELSELRRGDQTGLPSIGTR